MGNGPMYLVDGGQVHRAFLHIADAMEAMQIILDRPEETRNQIFNVGNPDNNVTIRELAEMMLAVYEELTGEQAGSQLRDVSGEEFYGVGYEDSDRMVPNISKMLALGWRPRRDLWITLRDAMGYYLEPGCLDRRRVLPAPSLAALTTSA